MNYVCAKCHMPIEQTQKDPSSLSIRGTCREHGSVIACIGSQDDLCDCCGGIKDQTTGICIIEPRK